MTTLQCFSSTPVLVLQDGTLKEALISFPQPINTNINNNSTTSISSPFFIQTQSLNNNHSNFPQNIHSPTSPINSPLNNINNVLTIMTPPLDTLSIDDNNISPFCQQQNNNIYTPTSAGINSSSFNDYTLNQSFNIGLSNSSSFVQLQSLNQTYQNNSIDNLSQIISPSQSTNFIQQHQPTSPILNKSNNNGDFFIPKPIQPTRNRLGSWFTLDSESSTLPGTPSNNHSPLFDEIQLSAAFLNNNNNDSLFNSQPSSFGSRNSLLLNNELEDFNNFRSYNSTPNSRKPTVYVPSPFANEAALTSESAAKQLARLTKKQTKERKKKLYDESRKDRLRKQKKGYEPSREDLIKAVKQLDTIKLPVSMKEDKEILSLIEQLRSSFIEGKRLVNEEKDFFDDLIKSMSSE